MPAMLPSWWRAWPLPLLPGWSPEGRHSGYAGFVWVDLIVLRKYPVLGAIFFLSFLFLRRNDMEGLVVVMAMVLRDGGGGGGGGEGVSS